MIVVVIIGILVSVAIPSYQSFKDKAKVTEAKVFLSEIYTAEKTYYAEFEKYSQDLYKIGLTPIKLKYFRAVGLGCRPGATNYT